MKLKVFNIGATLLLTLAVTLPLQSAPGKSGKAVQKPKPPQPSPQAVCLARLEDLALSALLYAMNNDDHLPDLSTATKIRSQLLDYVDAEAHFRCPAGHTYAGNKSLSNKYEGGLKNVDQLVLFYEPVSAHGKGRNVVYANGDTTYLSAAQWEQAKLKSGIH